MSRIGRQPIPIPSGVTVQLSDSVVSVSGVKGNLTVNILEGLTIKQEGQDIIVSRDNDDKVQRSNHGLMRALINNMVIGVSEGFVKKPEVNGVGYRVAQVQGGLKLSLGYSHDINYSLPENITASVEQNVISISGIDKQLVGQVASEIRAFRKPEPYKGKGIKYINEYIIRKSGKSGKEK